MKRKKQARRIGVAVHAALTGSLAFLVGQEAAAQTAPAQASASSLEEVIVTASRRQTTVEELPYNITAISGDALARTNTVDLADLANQVPGFSFPDRGNRFAGATVPIIRGLNASDTERSGIIVEQLPVGIYLGNSPVIGYLPIQDIERVEVLRGPQGTLYGAGALGGALRLIPVDPKLNEWSANVEASGYDVAHSSDIGYTAYGLLNAPLGPIAALRMSFYQEHQPGFIDQYGIMERQGNQITGVPVLANPADVANSPSVYYDKKDVNFGNISSGRVSLLVQPHSQLKFELAYNGSYIQGDNGPQDNPTYAGGPSQLDPRITFPATGNYQIVSPTLQPYYRHTDLTSLDASYDMGFATLSATSTYADTWAKTGTDSNVLILGLPASYLPYYTGNPINPRYVATSNYSDSDHRFTQEVRLVSSAGKVMDYVLGAFYEYDTRQLYWEIYEPGTTAQTLASGGLYVNTDPNGRTFVEHAPQQFDEKALFGELTWHITSRWQVTGGGRLFHQTLTQDQAFTSYVIGQSGGNNSSNSVTNHIFKLNTSYEYVDNQMVYATFSQGFRRGGVNAFPLTGFYQESPQILNYAPDKANNYELGIKGIVAKDIQYTADVFYIDWTDPQIGVSTLNTWPVAVNGKKAVSKGVELETHTMLFRPELNLSLAYSYTNARLTEDFCLPVGDGTGNPNGFIPCGIRGYDGERLPGTPENALSATLTYRQSLAAGRHLTYTLQANYKGSILNSLATIANNYDPVTLSGYTLVNASVLANLTEHLRLGLYSTNLFDKRAELAAPQRAVALLGNLANIYTITEPRHVGLKIAYDW